MRGRGRREGSRSCLLVSGLLVLALCAAACTDTSGKAELAADTSPTPTPSPTAQTVAPTPPPSVVGSSIDGVLTLALVAPGAAEAAPLVASMRHGVVLALQDLARAGGVAGAEVALVAAEAPGTEQAPELAELVHDQVVDAVVALGSGAQVLPALDALAPTGRLLCAPAAADAALSGYEEAVPGLLMRTAIPETLQGRALAEVMVADGRRRVVVGVGSDETSQAIAAELEADLVAAGVEPRRLAAADVARDAAIVAGEVDGVALVAAVDPGTELLGPLLREVPAERLYVDERLLRADLAEDVGLADPSDLNGLKGVGSAARGNADFSARFASTAADGTPELFAAHAYDCVVILALAAAAAGSDDPAAIGAKVVGVTRDGERCTDPAACLQLVADGADIDYDGVSGAGEWDPEGEPSVGVFQVWEVREGALKPLDLVEVG